MPALILFLIANVCANKALSPFNSSSSDKLFSKPSGTPFETSPSLSKEGSTPYPSNVPKKDLTHLPARERQGVSTSSS